MAFNISKTLVQRVGLDKDSFFKKNKNVSLTNLSRALIFSSRILMAGKNSFANYNPHMLREFYLKCYGVKLHTETVKGYVDTLLKFRLCSIANGVLSFKRLRSKHNGRNFRISIDANDSIRKAAIEIEKYIFSASMRAIGFIKDLKFKLQNPDSLSELKRARIAAKKLDFDIDRFEDRGISYKTLSKRFNISTATVAVLICRCIKDRIIEKVNHVVEEVIEKVSQKVGDIDKFISSNTEDFTRYFYVTCSDTLVLQTVRCNTYNYNPDNLNSLSYL